MTEAHTSDSLLPCPFCGGDAKAAKRDNPMSKWRWSVDCVSSTCGMSGPVEETQAAAVVAWNRRAGCAEEGSREPFLWNIDSKASPDETWEIVRGRLPDEYIGQPDFIVTPLYVSEVPISTNGDVGDVR